MRRALASRELGPLVWLSFIATFAFVAMESTFALFRERRFDYGAVEIGALFVFIGVMAAVAQGLLVGRLVERFGEVRVMIAGLVGTAAGLLLVGVSESLWALLPGLAVLAVALGARLLDHHRADLPDGAARRSRARCWGSRPGWAGRPASPAPSSPRSCSSTPASRRR